MTYFNLMNSQKGSLPRTKDRLFLMPVVMYFSKYSALPKAFNRELLLYAEFGFLEYWTVEYSDKRFSGDRYDQRIPKELKVKNITGILQICSVLLVFSIFVFVLEVLAIKFLLIRKFIEFSTY